MKGIIKHRAGAGVLLAFLAAVPAATYGQAHAHMAFTAAQPGTESDTARALDVVRKLRAATARYQTLADAEAAGYMPRQRADRVKPNGVLHVGRVRERGERPRPFDLSEPRVLLYRRAADGSMRLAGVMLVAPRDATGADLDAVIPRSVAPWHRHDSFRSAQGDSWTRKRFRRKKSISWRVFTSCTRSAITSPMTLQNL